MTLLQLGVCKSNLMYINKSWHIIPVGQACISSLILLRPLRMYILIQLFFSIWVNSGFTNLFIRGSAYIKPLFTDHLPPPPSFPYLKVRRSWVFFSTSSWVVQQNRAQSRLLYLFYDKEQLNSPHIPLFFISKRTSVVSMFYTLYHKARFFNKSECALYVNFIIEMQNKTVLITRTKVRLDTTLRD